MDWGRIIFTRHASERADEREFDRWLIREALENGFHCPSERNPSCRLCVYKVREQYYTIVYALEKGKTILVTIERSSPKEIKKAEKRWDK
ncbi:MAG: DUF4258 domain-containing protein [Candidatus Diapherotrites archaeon]